VATPIKAIEPSEETINEVFSEASKFEVEARKGISMKCYSKRF
jgi:hypothetical protein